MTIPEEIIQLYENRSYDGPHYPKKIHYSQLGYLGYGGRPHLYVGYPSFLSFSQTDYSHDMHVKSTQFKEHFKLVCATLNATIGRASEARSDRSGEKWDDIIEVL